MRGWESVTAEDIQRRQATDRRGVTWSPTQSPIKRSKYRAIRTVVDGVNFASKAEASRYHELKLQQRAGLISGLLLQRAYALVVNGAHVGNYVADFEYYRPDGELICEDVKGFKTPVYQLKKRLMAAIHHIAIAEVR